MAGKRKVKDSVNVEQKQQARNSSKQQRGEQALARVVQNNIHAIIEYQKKTVRKRKVQDRIADVITAFSGHMLFVYLHIVWFSAWLVINAGWFGLKPFDPYPFGLLTSIVSLEAIFLSTFVLISQNRMSEQDRQRSELDLQINLLTEHELTRVLQMLDQIQDRLGIDNEGDAELSELEKETKPEEILVEIEREEREERRKFSSGSDA